MTEERQPVTRHVEATYDPEKGKMRLEWSRNGEKAKRDWPPMLIAYAALTLAGLSLFAISFGS
jgi:hypothetical protein